MSNDPKLNEQSGIAVEHETKVKVPKKFKVLLHNDDYTTMEFVVHVLQRFFKKTIEEANGIMLSIHHEGVGVCGVYTYEVAETLAQKINRYSKDNGHPLKCSISPE